MTRDLTKLAKKLSKKFDDVGISIPGSDNNYVRKVDVIPSGSAMLDRAMGIGGYPRGRVVEIFGPESSGKTTLALHAVSEAQKLGLWAIYLDFEHAVDLDYAEALGVDLNQLMFIQPSSGEDGFRILQTILLDKEERKDLGIVIVDSVAAIQTKHQEDGEIGDAHIGQAARLLNSANRSLVPLLPIGGVCLMYINQLRANIGGYGQAEVTTGGKSIPYSASVRIRISGGQKIDKGGETIGKETNIVVVKNKLARPNRKVQTRIIFGKGIDRGFEVVNELVAQGKINKKGAWFATLDGESLGQGVDNCYENHREYLENLLAGSEIKFQEEVSIEEEVNYSEE